MVEYFLMNPTKGKLKVLDNNPLKDVYTGVTLPYIEKFVLKNKFSKEEIVNYIIKHHNRKNLYSLYCPTVKTVVIHVLSYQVNYEKGRKYGYDDNSSYKYFINHLNKFKNAE